MGLWRSLTVPQVFIPSFRSTPNYLPLMEAVVLGASGFGRRSRRSDRRAVQDRSKSCITAVVGTVTLATVFGAPASPPPPQFWAK